MSKQLLLPLFIAYIFSYSSFNNAMDKRRLKPFNHTEETTFFARLPQDLIKIVITDYLDLEDLQQSSYQLNKEKLKEAAQKLLSIKLVNKSSYEALTGIDCSKKNTDDNELSEDIFQTIINSVCGQQQWSINECAALFGMKKLHKDAQEARTIIECHNALLSEQEQAINNTRLTVLLKNNIVKQYTWYDYCPAEQNDFSKSGMTSLSTFFLEKQIAIPVSLADQTITKIDTKMNTYFSLIIKELSLLESKEKNCHERFITKHDIPVFMKYCKKKNIEPNLILYSFFNENILNAYEECKNKKELSFLRNTWLHSLFSDISFHCFYKNNHQKKVLKMLNDNINPNIQNYTKKTPLHLAVINDYPLESIQNLLKYNANPNLCDNNNCTPLYYAAKNRNRNKVELLLKHGADPKKGKIFAHVM